MCNLLLFILYSSHEIKKEKRKVVSTPTSYSGGLGFKISDRTPTIVTEIRRGFPQFLQANTGTLS
jgi:hypothetical protein